MGHTRTIHAQEYVAGIHRKSRPWIRAWFLEDAVEEDNKEADLDYSGMAVVTGEIKDTLRKHNDNEEEKKKKKKNEKHKGKKNKKEKVENKKNNDEKKQAVAPTA